MMTEYRVPNYAELMELEREARALRAHYMRQGVLAIGQWLRNGLTLGLGRTA